MKTFFSFVIKEARHILRDPRTMLILFGMPVVMMFLFGFAISNEVKNVRITVVTASMDNATQQIADQLGASEYFTLTSLVGTPSEAEQLIRDMKTDLAVIFSPRFGDHLTDRSASIQLLVNSTDPNTSLQQAAYASSIIQQAVGLSSSAVNVKLLYNPQMKSTYNFVPGIMGMLLLVICAMMTSVSIVKEKERGSMEVLLVSPVRPLMIIVAKAIPYFLLSFIIVTLILSVANFILGVPIAGSLLTIYGLSMLYILLALALGLLISIMANTQLVALLASGMILLMPSLLLSGMIYPVESMPSVLQYLSLIVPARWYIDAIRKVMIMGVSLQVVMTDILVLAGMTTVFITVALLRFKKRLE